MRLGLSHRSLSAALVGLGLLLMGLAPGAAWAGATLQIIQGSGDIQSLQTAITVDVAQPISLRWTTDEASATGGLWEVALASNPGQILAQGQVSPAPAVGHIAVFTIPASGMGSFLAANPPAAPVKYTITIIPLGAGNQMLGQASAAVSVTQAKNTSPPINFGAGAVFPDIELVSYVEKEGNVPNTEIQFAIATVTVRAVNNGTVPTDPMNLAVNDFNVLMRQTSNGVKVGALKPGQSSAPLTFQMSAVLPPPTSQLGQPQQFATWDKQYLQQCGVDLRVTLDWSGPQNQAPVNDHKEAYLYQGFHSSKPWQENHPVSDVTVCDGSVCVPLISVARSVYQQIGCKVVGYALFVGDKTSGPHAIYDAFGFARTASNPPQENFTPTTPMQIASSSKVLTGITALKVMGPKFDQPAVSFFPTNWSVPPASIVRNITAHQFVSMTSGVQQYYAGLNGQDFPTLQTFFTQPILNPNAPFSCPGSNTPSRIIPNPIIANNQPCYTDTNFGIMRLVIPRADGLNSNDPTQLADKYVSLVQANIWAPLGITGPACKPPAAPGYSLLYLYPGQVSGDWGDTTLSCGDWGWYVSVEEYGKLLISLNSADHKVLTDCQLYEVEHNPTSHPIGFDKNNDGAPGHRYLEKNGAEGTGNKALETTSVGIFLGHSGCPGKSPSSPAPGIAAALWINSNINGAATGVIASTILQNAFEASVVP